MSLKKEILNYIEKTTSWQITEDDLTVTLPFHIKRRYELWSATIAGKKVLFAHGNEVDIRRYYKTVFFIEESADVNVILVFDKLNLSDRERFIKKHISFVVKDKYIYMPFALMQIESEERASFPQKIKPLSPLADTLLLGYLVKEIASNLMISEIATLLSQTIRDVSNALVLLEQHGFVRIDKQGRKKMVYFKNEEEAFDYFVVQQHLPIKSTFFTDSNIEENKIIYSSFSALSKQSTLVDNSLRTVAIHIKDKLFLKSLRECFEEDAKYKVEVWDRDPLVFSINNRVNSLYLLRFFNYNDDERIDHALADIKKKIEESK